ncbi:L-lactate permease [Streptomyces sp. B1866]|uniref:L-lactate permease n=1 Tax=Streptomyces sp. B1866 TaxID=3075431 RepID=UPI002891440B|nr:L-lactate permease [Streptomyces sp. B1866]MDT3396703.1 L-lactate permease [Streptomyces sp. B1866]
MRPAWPELLAAIGPPVLLGVLVLRVRLKLAYATWAAVVPAAAVAAGPYHLSAKGLGVALGKGLWTGCWVLAIIVPALLLYGLCERAGAVDALGEELSRLAPDQGLRLVLLGVAFPIALQGVAGFGIPIALAAPLLVRGGMDPVAAVAAISIGYNWGVAFGSLGSPYFVLLATSGLPHAHATELAVRTAVVLGANCLCATLLVLRHVPRAQRRATAGLMVAVAAVMTAVSVGCAAVQPALSSFAAGLSGMAVCAALAWRRGGRADPGRTLRAALPYATLGALIVVASLPWVHRLGEAVSVGPSFPATTAGFHHLNAAVSEYTPLVLVRHPLTFLALAVAVAGAYYWRTGALDGKAARLALRTTGRRALPSVLSVPGLTVLAALMVESGMVSALAESLAGLLDGAYLPLVPLVAAAGTLIIGNNTAANALFGPFQAAAAGHLGVRETVLLAGQGAGATIGNTLAPVNLLVGLSAIGKQGEESRLIRRNLPDAALLVAVTALATTAQLWIT